jgi:predicted nucleotidyltransferase
VGREAPELTPEARHADPRIRGFVENHLPRLRLLYDPTLVLAFGSRARGDALDDSDLDLIVVSRHFEGVPFLERITRVLVDLDVPFGIDLLCYTPEELATKRQELGTVSAALEEGLAL